MFSPRPVPFSTRTINSGSVKMPEGSQCKCSEKDADSTNPCINPSCSKNINSTPLSNFTATLYSPSIREISKSPSVSMNRRVIRLDDAENPFTNGTYRNKVFPGTQVAPQRPIVSTNEVNRIPIHFQGNSEKERANLNFMIPDTVSISQSDHFQEKNDVFVKKTNLNHEKISFKLSEDTANTANRNSFKDSIDVATNVFNLNLRDESMSSSIGVNKDESEFTTDSKIQEVFNGL